MIALFLSLIFLLHHFSVCYFVAAGRQASSETLFYIDFNKVDANCTLLINHSLLLPPVTPEVLYDLNWMNFSFDTLFTQILTSFVSLGMLHDCPLLLFFKSPILYHLRMTVSILILYLSHFMCSWGGCERRSMPLVRTWTLPCRYCGVFALIPFRGRNKDTIVTSCGLRSKIRIC